jgi:hypothetical protein
MRRWNKLDPRLQKPAEIVEWRAGGPIIRLQVVRRAPGWPPAYNHVWLGLFRCPLCGRIHQHGLGDGAEPWGLDKPSHRAAHCDPESAGPGGYYLLATRGVVQWGGF